MAVRDPESGELTGYLVGVELVLAGQTEQPIDELVQTLPVVPPTMLHGEAIMLLQTNKAEMAVVTDAANRQTGIVRRDALINPLLGKGLRGNGVAGQMLANA